MKRWALLCFLSVFTSLLSNEEDCLCGKVSSDPLYARAVFLLHQSIINTGFHIGADFPEVADAFYPPVILRYDFDSHYPYEGMLKWNVIGKCYWKKNAISEEKEEDYVEIPSKIVREMEWTDHPDGEMNYEHRDKKVFNFQRQYGAIPQVFRALKNDISMYYEKSEIFLDARIRDLANKVPVYEWHVLTERLTNRKRLLKRKQKTQLECLEHLNFVEQKEAEASIACTQSLDWCIENHGSPLAHVDRGLFYYLEGNTLDALKQVEAALEKLTEKGFKKLKEEALFLKGEAELESGLYVDAVLTLTELIKQNPVNKEAYFDRANAYFELGNFDLSLQDYLASEVRSQMFVTDSMEMLPFSLGLTKGVLQGGVEAGIEFIPSLLSSLQGIGHGLWAFAQDPVQMSRAFVQASQACINFVREHTPEETLVQLVPELKDLIEKWDKLEDERKGEITGLIIGKYGVDIFAGVGLTKAMKSYRELKRANNLLTFEAMAISERNQSLIKLEAIKKGQVRKEILQQANLKIQWDKQGKHIEEHRNFQPGKDRSVLVHADPQRLGYAFCGKGMKTTSIYPGTPGYQEIVDFKEFIGYWVHPDTGEKIATSWGKIHYAKDGIHIVPTKPR